MDGVELKMDLFFPGNTTGATALTIFVHGGGWSKGDKADRQGAHEIPALVKAGFTVASLNYRLAPEYKFPAMIEDVKCAIRSFRAHAAEYNIDPNRIGVWGTSAGGHLVNLLGLTDPAAGFEQGEYLDQSSRVQAVVDMFGPANMAPDFSRAYLEVKDSVFGGVDLVQASPITYVTADDPPFLILHGDSDNVVPLDQSQILYDAMLAAGMDVEFTVVVGGNHGFTKPGSTPSREEITAMIVAFFEEKLK
jgi:acetyl esterase/lipase